MVFAEEGGCAGFRIRYFCQALRLFVEFNMRFLIPSTAVGALLLIAPIAALF